MVKVKVHLRPTVRNINLPTVLKTTIFPGDRAERLIIATQLGEIFYIGDRTIETFLDIRPLVLQLGTTSGGYDERGLLGLAFHPEFCYNGLFYLHYSVAGSQGPGIHPVPTAPDPCDPAALHRTWDNREVQYDHIDTVEEWIWQPRVQPQRRRTLLNFRRPFANHNGINSLNFSPETGKLILTTGDGGSGYDPFHLSQNNMEFFGKIIEIDVNKNLFNDNPPVITRFHELPVPVQETLAVIAKGVRNISGISFQKFFHNYIKYIGNVGQDLVESIFSFLDYKPIPVDKLVQASFMQAVPDQEGFVNFGWRGWEGAFPTAVIRSCPSNTALTKKTLAYYEDTVRTCAQRLQPLVSYFHQDPRPDKFGGTALTGVHPYMGNAIPELTGNIVFTDLARNESSPQPARGVLAYARVRSDCNLDDYSVIDTDYDFGSQSSYYVGLGTNLDQTRLYLGVYGSTKVADFNQGTIFEIVP
ncbi:glucose dehydrogenase [Anaerocolumna sedimenticola]|uniref:Glucose dehydrogenase n=1 Tax=Anaerocolumna sedimenticola TaxID=2696063 RepID=A0A6P1TNX5_9FIRM|nr:PQQ-dependent sugar dehydrogenase [Anaerocolumna sedimenticola]QHQ61516.1 glucose dehydrogenase [Anaerocolumna sedimenticola]